jgi:peptidoglycan/xylan/chitin deacetylase (PgdA/CDA1 family)
VAGHFRPIVLCYHGVSDEWDDPLGMPLAGLEAQIRLLLGRGYVPGGPQDVLDGRRRVLHVTFDDGYRSVLDALPILERYGVPSTVFVCTDLAREGRPLAVPELSLELEKNPAHLATLPWSTLRSLPSALVEIGSHTVSHPHLTQCSDAELREELGESRRELEDELGRPCPFIAYPFGEHDERVRAAVRTAGYQAAFALPGSLRAFDLMQIPRIGLWRRDADSPMRVRVKTATSVRLVGAGLRPQTRFTRVRRPPPGFAVFC